MADWANHAGERVFENTAVSTYDALDATGRAGARALWTSSESASGSPFAEHVPGPDSVPIDEDHPAGGPHGVSNVAGEAVAGRAGARPG